MIDQKYLSLLETLKYKNSYHSSRNLMTHLKGTYNLLHKWGNSKEVCLAGLFHSLYGTSSFKNKSVDIEKREIVQNVIGHKAEELAYLFCVTNRKFLEQVDKDEKELLNRFSNEKFKVSKETIKMLLEIEVANLIEQIPFIFFGKKRTLKYMNEILEKGKYYLSENAQIELKNSLNNINNNNFIRIFK